MKTKSSVLTSCVLVSFAHFCSGAVVYWNCSSAGSPSISGLDAGGITSAVFADPAVNQSGTSVALIDSSSASSGYSGASGGNNFEAKTKTGDLSVDSSTYFLVTLTPASGYAIRLDSISFGSRSTSTGPTSLTFYSSIDNYASAIGSKAVSANSTWALVGTTFGGSPPTGPVDTAVLFRIYGSGGSGTFTSANWRIDDISLSVTAVPEPTTSAVVFFGFLFGGAHLWRLLRRQVND